MDVVTVRVVVLIWVCFLLYASPILPFFCLNPSEYDGCFRASVVPKRKVKNWKKCLLSSKTRGGENNDNETNISIQHKHSRCYSNSLTRSYSLKDSRVELHTRSSTTAHLWSCGSVIQHEGQTWARRDQSSSSAHWQRKPLIKSVVHGETPVKDLLKVRRRVINESAGTAELGRCSA